jgi:hypothetical protein
MDSHLFDKWGAGLDPDLPRIVDAEREYLHTADGNRLVDAASGAAVVNLGHSLDVGDADRRQAEAVGYVSMSCFGVGVPEELASRLADLTPGDPTARRKCPSDGPKTGLTPVGGQCRTSVASDRWTPRIPFILCEHRCGRPGVNVVSDATACCP